jgi:hypothetical protein
MINKKYCNSSKESKCKKCGCEKKNNPSFFEKIKITLNKFLFKFGLK